MDKCGELDRPPAAIDETGGDPEMQQIQQMLMRRRDLFSANAEAAMAASDEEAAMEFVAASKQFDEVIAALAALPPSPPPYRKKKMNRRPWTKAKRERAEKEAAKLALAQTESSSPTPRLSPGGNLLTGDAALAAKKVKKEEPEESPSPTPRLSTGGNPLTGPGDATSAAKKVKKEEPEEEEAKNEQKERDRDIRSHRSRGNERGVMGGGGRVGDNSQHGSGDWRGQASSRGWGGAPIYQYREHDNSPHGSGDWRGQASGSGSGGAGRVNGAWPQYPMNDGRVQTSAVNPRSNGGYGGGGWRLY